jgi:predicted phage-related endonuclease
MLTEDQKRERVGHITSSIAAGALGLNPRMSPLQAWMAVRGELESPDTKAIERGNRLEDLILDYPAEVLGLVREPAPFMRHPIHKWAADSADALYINYDGETRLVGEGKSAALGISREYGEEGTDEVPNSTLVQSHWHLIHWPDVERCVVPVLVGGYQFEFRLYYVTRDVEFEGGILDDLAKWHRDYVVADKPPPVTAADFDRRYLLKLYPSDDLGTFDADEEIARWAVAKSSASDAIKAASAREEEAKNHLRQLLGEHSRAVAPWGYVSYKFNKPSSVTDWEGVARELGAPDEVIRKHTTTEQGARVLRVYVKE